MFVTDQAPVIYLATGNAHKVEEMSALFEGAPLSLAAAPCSLDVLENGKTYRENAFLKAQAYYRELEQPVLADDSGLEVAGLPGELGLMSARFGHEQGLRTQAEKLALLLEKMAPFTQWERRRAHFVCVLCFYLGPREVYFFEGEVQGYIGHTVAGEGGFGFDPLFIPVEFRGEGSDQTLAQLADWKMLHSHRARAVAELVAFLKRQNSRSAT